MRWLIPSLGLKRMYTVLNLCFFFRFLYIFSQNQVIDGGDSGDLSSIKQWLENYEIKQSNVINIATDTHIHC